MTMPTPTQTPYGTPDNSYEAGFIDGELAVMESLTSRRATARIEMAADHDRMYAQGYSDGYLHATAINAARLQNGETR